MTPLFPEGVTERVLIREALAVSATSESIGRKLGDELIAAARAVVAARRESTYAQRRLDRAIHRLAELVGQT